MVEEEAFSVNRQSAVTTVTSISTPPPGPSGLQLSSLQSSLSSSVQSSSRSSNTVQSSSSIHSSSNLSSNTLGPDTVARPKISSFVTSTRSGDGGDLLIITTETERSLLTKSLSLVTTTLDRANRELETCQNPERMTQLVILIRESATTLVTLKQLLCDNNQML